MSLRRNVIANSMSQLYVALVGVVMVPVYLRHMGAEAYGLIGFFTTLQAFFQLLDLGLTPTMAREAARFRGGALDATSLRLLLRGLEGIFFAIALIGGLSLFAGATAIAGDWLKPQHLSEAEVATSVRLIAIIVALRWLSGLYRGAINGFERMVWLSAANIAVATVRFVLVVPFFEYAGPTASNFFVYQLAVAVVELAVLAGYTYSLLPRQPTSERVSWAWQPIRRVLVFSLSIAFTGSVWVLVTQADKLLLSKLLPLRDYAHFTLAVLVAGAVTMISGPIGSALLPRLTAMCAAGDDSKLLSLYRNATQFVAVLAIPLALVLAFFAHAVLWAWTGDETIAGRVAPVLTLYAVGNAILALTAFPYYLQFAKGDLKLHLIGHALFALMLVPALLWSTSKWGMVGAGYAWVAANCCYFVFWVPRMHRRFFRGLHTQWLLHDLAAVVLACVLVAAAVRGLCAPPRDRLDAGFQAIAVALVLVATSAVASSWVRGQFSVLCRGLPLFRT